MKAIVTGASRGIGKAIADMLTTQGYEVETIGRSDQRKVRLDIPITDNHIINDHVDVLVNNAWSTYYAPAKDYELAAWYQQMDFLSAYFALCQQAYRHGATRIINIASEAGLHGTRGCIGYSVAKAGVIHMTKCLSNEWAGECTVNCICPGFIETDALKDAFHDQAHRSRMVDLIPMQRIGTVYDLLPAVEYLLKADYVSGAVLTVDGGWSNR